MVRLCFVCLGNICRSPTAEGVMRALVRDAGLADAFQLESAGTAGYHAGEWSDARACSAGKARGFEVGGKARQFQAKDFDRFDYVLAMDRSNLEDLQAIARNAQDRSKVRLLRSFDPDAPPGASVPDPYYGGPEGFDEVIDICERACGALLRTLQKEHRL